MQQLTIGTLLRGGTYKIEEALGQGSFGITYLAEHTSLNRKVAIKEFFMKEVNSRGEDGSITGMSDGSLSYNYCRKFQKEAINLSHLDHPNIVRVTDSFSENGTFYYVMDYIDGQNLNDYIKSHHVDADEAVSIIKSTADALIYMHETQHMLHLDIKPGNIMRRASDGHIFLIDFGLSKHYDANGQPETSTNIGLGTAGYAPIEQGNQAKSGEFRPTIDVYALGATLYKLLTRETPPNASELVSDDELLENNLRVNGVSENLIKVVKEAMCPNVRKRTQTVRDFKNNIVNVKAEKQSMIDNTSDPTINGIDVERTIVANPEEHKTTSPEVNDENAEEEGEPHVEFIEEEPMKYSIFSFKGRVGRLQYWATVFGGMFVFFLPIILVAKYIEGTSSDSIFTIAGILWAFLYYYIAYSVGAKRCHDLGHSGWYQIIPFFCLFMLFMAGEEGDNEYGKENDGISKKNLKILCGIIVVICAIICAIGFLGEDKAKLYGQAEDMIEGHIIENGVIQPEDSATALPIIQELADKQYGPAMCMLAQYYENGSAGITKDSIEAIRLCEQAFPVLLKEAEAGDMYSQCALSLIYSSGEVVQMDNSKAFTWMQKSAEQGYGDALGNLAVYYLNGIGCNENAQKAFECVRKAAEVDKTNGVSLASMYLQGLGTKIDTVRAISICKELADMKSWRAQSQLGHIYFEQDKYEMAFKYLSAAEKKDDLQAIDELTVLYLRG